MTIYPVGGMYWKRRRERISAKEFLRTVHRKCYPDLPYCFTTYFCVPSVWFK